MNMYDKIADVAYSIYEKNGKGDGWDLDNWLEAERIVLGQEVQQWVEEPGANVKKTRTKAAKTNSTRKTTRAKKTL